MHLSIIIVNWNAEAFLRKCLSSLIGAGLSDSERQAEIIVVDNASTDGSTELIRKEFPSVQMVANPSNAGFAKANNQAFQLCKGEYILLLNPDTEVRPDSLQELVDFMEGHPQVGAAGARLLNTDGTLQTSCYPKPTLMREFWRLFHLDVIWPLGVYAMDRWNLDQPRAVEVLKGACVMLRREACLNVLLDEDYFIYSEDVDLSERLRVRGWKLFWVPQAKVVHHGKQSTSQVKGEMFLHLYEGKVLFFRKHHGRLAARAYKVILASAALARQLLSLPAILKGASARQQNLLLARHYRKLLRALPGF